MLFGVRDRWASQWSCRRASASIGQFRAVFGQINQFTVSWIRGRGSGHGSGRVLVMDLVVDWVYDLFCDF